MRAHVALLRGINVGAVGRGRRSVPMKELRTLADELGYAAVRTYIQSGNLLFEAEGARARLEQELEAAIAERFGHDVPVVVLTAATALGLEAECPFDVAADERPQLVHVGCPKKAPPRSIVRELAGYCRDGEVVELHGGRLWVDYAGGVARSKLTPAVVDRLVGARVTFRNLKTVRAIAELLARG